MINIFRKIRSTALFDSNISKYLLYAFGEIILVMIGILLALQVNNWNEAKKTSAAIVSALIETKEDLEKDTLLLQENILNHQEDLLAQSRVIEVLERKTPWSKQTYNDLGRVMLKRPITLLNNGYKIIEEIGINNLNDVDFRNSMVQYYGLIVEEVQDEIEDDTFEFENIWLPYVRDNFKEWNFSKYGLPADYQNFLNDSYLLVSLKINNNNLSATLDVKQRAFIAAKKLIQLIDERIKS
jgi:hypothetical protein